LEQESQLLRFYRGEATDSEGRRLDEILGWDDRFLEGVHDYIQWLFPLDERSAFNPDAPLVTRADRDAFTTDERLGANLRRAFKRLLAFYGFRLVEGDAGSVVEQDESRPSKARLWLQPHNHNYLRQSRIIKSLALLGQPALARAFGEALLKEFARTPDLIGPTTATYWKDALTRTVSRPDATPR
jgi:hypothetical protein